MTKPTGRPTGRKPKISNELIDNICKLIDAGCFIKEACSACGIDDSTYFNYNKKGELDVSNSKDTLYSKFFTRTKIANAKIKADIIEVVISQAKAKKPNSWLPAAWWLERRYPEEFGRRIVQPVIENKILIALQERGKELIEISEVKSLTNPLALPAKCDSGASGRDNP